MKKEEEEAVQDFAKRMQTDLDTLRATNADLKNRVITMDAKEDSSDNMIKYQLDIQQELAIIEHLLRGDKIKYDEKGDPDYQSPKPEEAILNEKGVEKIMENLQWYLNKGLILSNFSKEQIDLRMKQFASRFTSFLFLNHRDFGMDTREKIRHYPILVNNVVNIVEAQYYRALNGFENIGLRTRGHVVESVSSGNARYNLPIKSSKFSISNLARR